MNFENVRICTSALIGMFTYVTPPTKRVRLRTGSIVSMSFVCWREVHATYP